MFRFEHEHYLYALILIPVFVVIYIGLTIFAKKRLAKYGDSTILTKLMPEHSPAMKHIKFSLLMLALACFIFALANPQVGSSLEKGMRKGVDVMLCLDVSNSMLAEDMQPNRLEASKMAMSRFIDKLKGDRVGLVVFAGTSFVQLPITSDYAAAKMFINQVSPNMINEQGTDIAAALDLAAVSMLPEDVDVKEVATINDLTSKVIVVVSDGEDHFLTASQLAAKINKMGMTVHTIGIGSTRGEPIPIRGRNGTVNYKKDREGNTVMTRLNEAALKDVAAAGGGVYVHAGNANMGFEKILEEIGRMQKTDIEEITFARYESRYQWPLIIGLILLIIESFLFVTKPKWIRWFMDKQEHLRMKPMIILLFLSLGTITLQAQTKEELQAIRRGTTEFNEAEKLRTQALELLNEGGNINQQEANAKMKQAYEKYQNAEINYRKAMETTKSYDKANYNLGTTLYRQEKYEDATESFKQVAEQQSADKQLRAKSYHNMGNSLMKQEKYNESIKAYKDALKLDPKDMETKYNLEYAKKKLIQQQQQQQQQQNQDQNKDQQDQQDQQQQQGQQDQNKNQDQENQQQQQQQDSKEEQQKKQEQQAAEREQKETDKRQLDALQQNERRTQEKVQQQEMQSGKKVKQEKDW